MLGPGYDESSGAASGLWSEPEVKSVLAGPGGKRLRAA